MCTCSTPPFHLSPSTSLAQIFSLVYICTVQLLSQRRATTSSHSRMKGSSAESSDEISSWDLQVSNAIITYRCYTHASVYLITRELKGTDAQMYTSKQALHTDAASPSSLMVPLRDLLNPQVNRLKLVSSICNVGGLGQTRSVSPWPGNRPHITTHRNW